MTMFSEFNSILRRAVDSSFMFIITCLSLPSEANLHNSDRIKQALEVRLLRSSYTVKCLSSISTSNVHLALI